MLLLVDAGNTRIKWAVLDDSGTLPGTRISESPAWLAYGSVIHAKASSLQQEWHALIDQGMVITRIVISNVAGEEVKAMLTSFLEHSLSSILATPAFARVQPEWFASQPQAAGIRNAYRNPTQLGCDRFATAIAAHAFYPQQAIIVATCGTATTIDAISADGVFHGGMILPGLKLMAQSLAKNTAQLPQVAESISTTNLFADHTESAIVSGCINAQVGALERAVSRWQAIQNKPVTCLISGGAASYLAPHLGIACQHVDNLVLAGLAVFAATTVATNGTVGIA